MKYKYYNAHPEGEKIDPSTRRLVRFNGIIAAATAVVAIFTAVSVYDQGCFNSAQISRMDSTLKEQHTFDTAQNHRVDSQLVHSHIADSTQAAFDTSQISVSQKTMIDGLRAYVSVTTVNMPGITPNGHVEVAVRNHGQTPAYHVHGSLNFEFYNTSSKSPLKAETTSEGSDTRPLYTGETPIEYDDTLTSDEKWEAAHIQDHMFILYIWGEVTYLDAFGIERHTWYKFSTETKAPIDPTVYRVCADGNKAD